MPTPNDDTVFAVLTYELTDDDDDDIDEPIAGVACPTRAEARRLVDRAAELFEDIGLKVAWVDRYCFTVASQTDEFLQVQISKEEASGE